MFSKLWNISRTNNFGKINMYDEDEAEVIDDFDVDYDYYMATGELREYFEGDDYVVDYIEDHVDDYIDDYIDDYMAESCEPEPIEKSTPVLIEECRARLERQQAYLVEYPARTAIILKQIKEEDTQLQYLKMKRRNELFRRAAVICAFVILLIILYCWLIK